MDIRKGYLASNGGRNSPKIHAYFRLRIPDWWRRIRAFAPAIRTEQATTMSRRLRAAYAATIEPLRLAFLLGWITAWLFIRTMASNRRS